MIGAIQIGLAGLNAAAQKAEKSASAIVTAGAVGGDLAGPAIDLKLAETAFKANALVIKAADDMQKDLLRALDIKT